MDIGGRGKDRLAVGEVGDALRLLVDCFFSNLCVVGEEGVSGCTFCTSVFRLDSGDPCSLGERSILSITFDNRTSATLSFLFPSTNVLLLGIPGESFKTAEDPLPFLS